jgi:hypothetical protein
MVMQRLPARLPSQRAVVLVDSLRPSFAIIRRVNVLRFLFGMKPLRRSAQAAPAVTPVPQQ